MLNKYILTLLLARIKKVKEQLNHAENVIYVDSAVISGVRYKITQYFNR